jgi:hypothetical protein
VFIPERLRKGLEEHDGWAIIQEGKAWLGIRPLSNDGYDIKVVEKKQVKESTRQNTDGSWLWPKAKDPTVVLVLSREAKHKTLADFLTYLASHAFGINKGVAQYTFADDLGAKVQLDLGKALNVPRMNGKPINLYPKKVFDSPYLHSDHGSGVVTITKDGETLVLDFHRK